MEDPSTLKVVLPRALLREVEEVAKAEDASLSFVARRAIKEAMARRAQGRV